MKTNLYSRTSLVALLTVLALSLCLCPAPAQTTPSLDVGLVSYWPLDSTNVDGTTPDLTSFGNTMTNKNSPSLVSGVRSNCLSFNGSTHYVTRTHGFSPESDGLPIFWAPAGYTVAFWVKGAPQTAAGRGLFVMGNSTNLNPTLRISTDKTANGNKLSLYVKDITGTLLINQINSTSVVLDNTWHHIAWVDNKGTATLYVDGAVDSSLYNYTVPAPEMLPLNLTRVGASARSANITYFNGAVDEVAIWERALSQAEVQQVRTNGIPELVPAEPIRITSAELVAGKLRFTVQAQSPTQVISIEQKTELTGTWGGASGGGIVATNGLVWTAEFPANAPQRFYRAVGH